MNNLYMGIDQGTTSTKVVITDGRGKILYKASRSVRTYTQGNKIYQNPADILRSVKSSIRETLRFVSREKMSLAGAGIATQRSSFLLFDRKGDPLTPIISWRDISGSDLLASLKKHEKSVTKLTGLPLTPYYSAPKIVHNLPSGRKEVLFGTVNTFLIYNLTGGSVYATDPGNAQRTLLFDLGEMSFSSDLRTLFKVPKRVRFPAIRDTVDDYGIISMGGIAFPLNASSGDQQAAFHASTGWESGKGLINLGTGGFMLVPLKEKPVRPGRFITTVSHSCGGKLFFLLEGTVNAVSDTARYFGKLFEPLPHGYVHKKRNIPVVVYGMQGTGAPLWDDEFSPLISGLNADTLPREVTYSALLGSLCYFRLIDSAMKSLDLDGSEFVVSGGVSIVEGVPEFIRDLLGKKVYRSNNPELTATGAALLSGGRESNRRKIRGEKFLAPVRKKSVIDAENYFEEWIQLYNFAKSR